LTRGQIALIIPLVLVLPNKRVNLIVAPIHKKESSVSRVLKQLKRAKDS